MSDPIHRRRFLALAPAAALGALAALPPPQRLTGTRGTAPGGSTRSPVPASTGRVC